MSRSQPSTPTKPTDRQAALFFACTFAGFAGIVLWLSGASWPIVVYKLIVDGGLAFIWVMAAYGVGATVLKLARISCDSKALSVATSAGLGLGLISLSVLGLGLAGWLNRVTAIALIAVGVFAAFVQLIPRVSNFRFEAPSSKRDLWLWLILVPSAAVATVAALLPPGFMWRDEPHPYDVVEYHLQVPREWYEAGRIVPLQHNVFSYFPFNVEMHYLLAMHLKGGPWAGMYLAQLMSLGFIVLTVVALAGISKPLAAILAGAVPWMLLLGSVAYNEAGLLLFSTLSIGWAMRSRELRQMLLAGAFAGFACGTKPTAVPMLLLAVPVALLFALSLRERVGVRAAAGYILAGMVTFSPWLIRNTVWTHNPIFPEGMSIFGRAHFSEAQAQRWTNAHSATADQRVPAFWTQFLREWKFGFAIIPLAIVAAALNRSKPTGFLTVLLLLQLIFWIGFTHVQGRFLVTVIPIAAILIGQMDLPVWRTLTISGAVLSVMVGCAGAYERLHRALPAIGIESYAALLPDVVSAVAESNRPLVLVGDAEAFKYPLPMSRLRYRTVFDVDVKPGQSVIDAWIGDSRPADAVILVTPSELDRFARTYWMIPKTEFPSAEPYVLPP